MERTKRGLVFDAPPEDFLVPTNTNGENNKNNDGSFFFGAALLAPPKSGGSVDFPLALPPPPPSTVALDPFPETRRLRIRSRTP